MFAYIVRRLAYAIPILIGINLLTFYLFFVVNSPDDMARMHLGMKRVTPEAIENWKASHGYDKPLLVNTDAADIQKLTDTIFFEKSLKLFVFDFGSSDDGRDISFDIGQRMLPSLAIAVPSLIIGLLVNITFALLMAFFRGTYVDLSGVILCVVLMSVSAMFYIIGGQYLLAKVFRLVPISGFDSGLDAVKFIILPVVIDDEHDRVRSRRGVRFRVLRRHDACIPGTGRSTMTVVPPPAAGSMATEPSWSTTMPCTMLRPSPIPPCSWRVE